MNKLKYAVLLVPIFLVACSGSDQASDPENGSAIISSGAHESERTSIQINIKQGSQKWTEFRVLRALDGGYALSAPITLPIGGVDEVVLQYGQAEIARFSGDDTKQQQQAITAFGRPLGISFRRQPERLTIVWVDDKAATSMGYRPVRGILAGGYKIRNNSKSVIVLKTQPTGWAHVSQVERYWHMVRVAPCNNVFTSVSETNSILRNIEVQLEASELRLNPGEERILSVEVFGASADSIFEWGGLLGKKSGPRFIDGFIFVGRLGLDFGSVGSAPAGSNAFCGSDRNIYARRARIPNGLDRSAASLALSPKVRRLRVAFAEDSSSDVFTEQELPVVSDFSALDR